MKTLTLTETPYKILVAIATGNDLIYCHGRGKKTVAKYGISVRWAGASYLKDSIVAVIAATKAEIIKFVGNCEAAKVAQVQWLIDLGLTQEDALYCGSRGFEPHHIVKISEVTEFHGLKVDGTYFGSGSYNASFRTNCEIGTETERNTGFAYELTYPVILEKVGDYLIQTKSAYPGGTSKQVTIFV